MKLDIPHFETKKELYSFLVANKSTLVAQKKAETKEADGFAFTETSQITAKSINKDSEEKDVLTVKAVINTTNILDSHGDVHIPGIWSKSVKENKNILHVREHQSSKFDYIISQGKDLNVTTESFSFKELGFKFDGNTEALLFESKIRKSANEFMYNRYKDGNVSNHSVGMRYVKLALAINDKDEVSEFAVWEKYYGQIANKADADNAGYFWAVTEAKVIEGSAVPLGSNTVTPTISVTGKTEPGNHSIDDKEKQAAEALVELRNFNKKFQ